MLNNNIKILMIYIEPTPYIIDLLIQLETLNYADLDVIFIKNNYSQQWNLVLDEKSYSFLPMGLLSSIKLIRKKINTGNYSLIHLAGWGDKTLLFTLVYGWLKGIAIAVESDTPLSINTSFIKKAAKRLLMPRLFQLPSMFLPGGTEQKQYLKYYGVEEDRISVVNMTVDIKRIRSYLATHTIEKGRYGIIKDELVFLYVGMLEKHKGIIELITAFSIFYKNNKGVKLIVTGDGSLNYAVKNAAKLCPGIHHTGRLSGNELLDVYSSSSLFILPSRSESWGLVINEAMAAGLPVIVSERVGCKTDLVLNKETGIIVESESIIALTEAMEIMYKEDSKRELFSRNAKILINDWTKENEARRIKNAWEKLKLTIPIITI